MRITYKNIEEYRGKRVLVVFKKSVDSSPLEGTLFSIDSKSQTVFLYTVNQDRECLQIILNDNIENIESK